MKKISITIISLFFIVFTIGCSGGDSSEYIEADGDAIDVPGTECVYDNDCDGDGLITTCDVDDEDAANVTIKEGCDEDGDGFVDLSCASYADENGDGVVTAEERNDISCDVCPGVDDPDQIDSDEDGIGDECGYLLSVNESEEPPVDEGEESGDGGEGDEGDDTEYTETAEMSLVDYSDVIKKGFGFFSVDLKIDNDASVQTYYVDVAFKNKAGMGKGILKGIVNQFAACGTKFATCEYTNEQEIEVPAGEVSEYGLTFKIPSGIGAGNYYIQVRLKYIDDDGNAAVMDRVVGDDTVEVSGVSKI